MDDMNFQYLRKHRDIKKGRLEIKYLVKYYLPNPTLYLNALFI